MRVLASLALLPAAVSAVQLRARVARNAVLGADDHPMHQIKQSHDTKRAESIQEMKDKCAKDEKIEDQKKCSWQLLFWNGLEIKVDHIVQDAEDHESKKLQQELKKEGEQYQFDELDDCIKAGSCTEEIRRTAAALWKWVKDLKKKCAEFEVPEKDCDQNELHAKQAARIKLHELCKAHSIAEEKCTGPRLAAKIAGEEEEKLELAECTNLGLSKNQCSTSNTAGVTAGDRSREELTKKNVEEEADAENGVETTTAATTTKQSGASANVVAAAAAALVLAWA